MRKQMSFLDHFDFLWEAAGERRGFQGLAKWITLTGLAFYFGVGSFGSWSATSHCIPSRVCKIAATFHGKSVGNQQDCTQMNRNELELCGTAGQPVAGNISVEKHFSSITLIKTSHSPVHTAHYLLQRPRPLHALCTALTHAQIQKLQQEATMQQVLMLWCFWWCVYFINIIWFSLILFMPFFLSLLLLVCVFAAGCATIWPSCFLFYLLLLKKST